MSDIEDSDYGSFAVTPASDMAPRMSGTHLTATERQIMLQRHLANPDDWPVERPPMGPNGPLPGPNLSGAPGRVAIVQGQVYIVAVILIGQLWLITTALYEFLSAHYEPLWWMAIASGVGFVIALIVQFWPRRRIKGLG